MAVPAAELAASQQAGEPACPTARVRGITSGIRYM